MNRTAKVISTAVSPEVVPVDVSQTSHIGLFGPAVPPQISFGFTGLIAVSNHTGANVLVSSDDGLSWNAVPAATSAAALNDIVFCYRYGAITGLPPWVTVGKSGAWFKSHGGYVWLSLSSGVANDLNAVTVNDATSPVAVAVGAAGQWVDWDGTTFTSGTLAGAPVLNDIAWSVGLQLFCAVGASGNIWTSPDGSTWTQQTSNTTKDLYCIVWDPVTIQFIACGTGTTTANTVLTSPDGVTWTVQTFVVSYTNAATIYDIDVNGEYMMAVGYDQHGHTYIYTSSDGQLWTQVWTNPGGTLIAFYALAWSGIMWVFPGSASNGLYSPDGVNFHFAGAGTTTGATPSAVPVAIAAGFIGRPPVVGLIGRATGTPIAITGDTNEHILFDTTIQGSTLGADGCIKVELDADLKNNTGVNHGVTIKVYYNATAYLSFSMSIGSNAQVRPLTMWARLRAAGATNKQIAVGDAIVGGTGNDATTGVSGVLSTITPHQLAMYNAIAEDSTQNLEFKVTATLDSAAANLVCNIYGVEVTNTLA